MSALTYRRLSEKLAGAAIHLEAMAEDFGGLDERLADHLRKQADRLRNWSDSAGRKERFDPLPAGQERVLSFLEYFIERNHYPPTRAEIAQTLGFKSPNAAEEHLRALERKGVIAIEPGIARGLKVIR